jgi:hypothetical protein
LWHWLPTWADKTAFEKDPKISACGRAVVDGVWDNENREFSVGAGTSCTLRAALIFYPHWKASINDQPAEVLKGADGTVNLILPEKDARVRLFFEEPAKSLVSRKVSVAAWILMLMIFPVQMLLSKKRPPNRQST